MGYKIMDYLCSHCGHQFEAMVETTERSTLCPQCRKDTTYTLPSLFGGYRMTGANSASTTPKGAGSKRRRKTA